MNASSQRNHRARHTSTVATAAAANGNSRESKGGREHDIVARIVAATAS
jgi:hypothetical protein